MPVAAAVTLFTLNRHQAACCYVLLPRDRQTGRQAGRQALARMTAGPIASADSVEGAAAPTASPRACSTAQHSMAQVQVQGAGACR